jgi:hypothetical protein
VRLIQKHRPGLDRVALALLEKESLNRDELVALFADIRPESSSSTDVGTVRVVPISGDP